MSTEKTWFGQPRGLTVLFLTEMWTAFSFYGMRTILIYYMTKELLFSQAHASLVYGSYISLAFFTPLFGGMISDRLLGRKRAVILGGSIMALGHFMMTFPALLYPALFTIALGNGLFLPSLPSQINLLYDENDPRRASAYNVYYVGVNVGGFLAPLGVGTVGELLGWHWGFALAGIGMVAGLIVYISGQHYLPTDTRQTAQVPAQQRTVPFETYLVLAAVVLVVVLFRAAYEQVGNSIALWADTGIDRSVGHYAIPMTWFQSLNSLLIFVLSPFVIWYWTRRARRGSEPGDVFKMALGGFTSAASYLLIAAVAWWSAKNGTQASWLWLVLWFLIYTLGELFILPVGLGLFGRMAPPGFAATAIAAWFLAAFAGNFASGVLGAFWGTMSPAAFFALTAGVAGLSGVLLLSLAPWSQRVQRHAAAPPAALEPAE